MLLYPRSRLPSHFFLTIFCFFVCPFLVASSHSYFFGFCSSSFWFYDNNNKLLLLEVILNFWFIQIPIFMTAKLFSSFLFVSGWESNSIVIFQKVFFTILQKPKMRIISQSKSMELNHWRVFRYQRLFCYLIYFRWKSGTGHERRERDRTKNTLREFHKTDAVHDFCNNSLPKVLEDRDCFWFLTLCCCVVFHFILFIAQFALLFVCIACSGETKQTWC